MQVWLQLTDQAAEENDAVKIVRNGEAQHRYLTWRTEKVCIFARTMD
jgi:phytochromobilin:ferredoxin oxidoreductase